MLVLVKYRYTRCMYVFMYATDDVRSSNIITIAIHSTITISGPPTVVAASHVVVIAKLLILLVVVVALLLLARGGDRGQPGLILLGRDAVLVTL